MKPAEEWCEEMFGKSNWVVADTKTINAIRHEALLHAAGMIIEDGNPMVAKERILAEANKLKP